MTKSPISVKIHKRRGHGAPDKELLAMFDQLTYMKRYKVAPKVVKAGADVIVPRARALTPDGMATGNSAKRARKQANKAQWKIPLHTTIDYVTRTPRGANAYSVIGPRWPEGNKAYFNTSPRGRRVWYWGKDMGRTQAQVRNWIIQAFDETRGRHQAKMKQVLKRELDKIWRT